MSNMVKKACCMNNFSIKGKFVMHLYSGEKKQIVQVFVLNGTRELTKDIFFRLKTTSNSVSNY